MLFGNRPITSAILTLLVEYENKMILYGWATLSTPPDLRKHK